MHIAKVKVFFKKTTKVLFRIMLVPAHMNKLT